MKNRWDLIGCEPFSNIVGGLTQEQKHIIYENNYYELQKYKKLEEEIGCPLEVRLKITHNESVYNTNGTEFLIGYIYNDGFSINYSFFS